jgi:hypothetical protein
MIFPRDGYGIVEWRSAVALSLLTDAWTPWLSGSSVVVDFGFVTSGFTDERNLCIIRKH